MTSNLFSTSLNFRLPVYFSPLNDTLATGTVAFLQDWSGMQAYAFPPFALIRQVLVKLRPCRGTELTLIAPYWPQKEWFPDLLSLSIVPLVVLLRWRDLLCTKISMCFSFMPGDCPAICQACRFIQRGGSAAFCRRDSSHRLHQHRWDCYRRWCSLKERLF